MYTASVKFDNNYYRDRKLSCIKTFGVAKNYAIFYMWSFISCICCIKLRPISKFGLNLNHWGKSKSSYAITKLTAHFTWRLMYVILICKQRKVWSYIAPVSLLRPGVIKQHKLKNQLLVLSLYIEDQSLIRVLYMKRCYVQIPVLLFYFCLHWNIQCSNHNVNNINVKCKSQNKLKFVFTGEEILAMTKEQM